MHCDAIAEIRSLPCRTVNMMRNQAFDKTVIEDASLQSATLQANVPPVTPRALYGLALHTEIPVSHANDMPSGLSMAPTNHSLLR